MASGFEKKLLTSCLVDVGKTGNLYRMLLRFIIINERNREFDFLYVGIRASESRFYTRHEKIETPGSLYSIWPGGKRPVPAKARLRLNSTSVALGGQRKELRLFLSGK